MHTTGAVLGIDTSAYTTSAAVVHSDGSSIVWDRRRLLQIPVGQRGLRQSDAVFQHISALPDLLAEGFSSVQGLQVQAVGASVAPRSSADSYMPVFRAGTNIAKSIAAALSVPFIACSHQEGHLWAAGFASEPRYAWGDLSGYLCLHLSGGTTELLWIEHGTDWSITVVGGTSDLKLGQLVDRIGVKLGFPFPAGPHVDRLAQEGTGAEPVRVPVNECTLSLSGAEAELMRRIDRGEPPADVAYSLLAGAAVGLGRIVSAARRRYGSMPLLCFGGVAASSVLRSQLALHVPMISFGPPHLSSDNAVGVALHAAFRLGASTT